MVHVGAGRSNSTLISNMLSWLISYAQHIEHELNPHWRSLYLYIIFDYLLLLNFGHLDNMVLDSPTCQISFASGMHICFSCRAAYVIRLKHELTFSINLS